MILILHFTSYPFSWYTSTQLHMRTYVHITFLQGCSIKNEILQSPMISYRSLLFIATAMNDTTIMQIRTYVVHLLVVSVMVTVATPGVPTM